MARTGTTKLSPAILGILNRLKLANDSMRPAIINELLAELDARQSNNQFTDKSDIIVFNDLLRDAWNTAPGKKEPEHLLRVLAAAQNNFSATSSRLDNDVTSFSAPSPELVQMTVTEQIATLRDQLREPNVRENGVAIARICGQLRKLRGIQ